MLPLTRLLLLYYPTLAFLHNLRIPCLLAVPPPLLVRFLVPQMSHPNPLTSISPPDARSPLTPVPAAAVSPACAPPPLDQYASSVSSADLSPPPRPDSPRLLPADSSAIAHARLRQLAVWGAAAEDHRDEQHADIDVLPPTLCALPLPDRAPDASFIRRTSLFVGSATVPPRRMSRAPSLWLRNRNTSSTTTTTFTSYSSSAAPTLPCGVSRSRGSFLRRSSFHRYARVTEHSQSSPSANATTTSRPQKEDLHSDFDDLVDGLHATKVTETTLTGTL